tara:strand:- start:24 stop:749 length:726 start_codon:yes stop_codon:yes gene_type:complete
VYNRKQFPDPRLFDVLVSSPEHFKKYNNVKDSQSVQLNSLYPVTKKGESNIDTRATNELVQRVLRPESGDQVHHKNALSLIGIALDNADDAGKAQIYNLLEHNGVNIGDDIYNLINLPQRVHEDHHRFTRDQGLEMQGRGTKGLARRIKDSSNIDDTLEYVQDYIDYGIPMIRENIDDLLTEYHASAGAGKRFADKSVLDAYRQAIDGNINTSDQGKAVNIFADTVLMEKGINGTGKNGKR